jgi:hypothetical protein
MNQKVDMTNVIVPERFLRLRDLERSPIPESRIDVFWEYMETQSHLSIDAEGEEHKQWSIDICMLADAVYTIELLQEKLKAIDSQ